MKWIPYENSLISEDRRVLKADSVEKLPEKLKCSFRNGFDYKGYLAKIREINLYADPYTINGSYDVKNEVTGVTFESSCNARTIVNEKILKKFAQKKSVYFLGDSMSPLLIVNKNFCVIISPCNTGKQIKHIWDCWTIE